MEGMRQGNKRHGNRVFKTWYRVIRGSSEIWSDKLKGLYNGHTETRRGRSLCYVTEVPTAQRVTEV